jgi:hypothetical protein
MRSEKDDLDEIERGQQQLRESIQISDRLIGEARQRVEVSRALAAGDWGADAEGQETGELG